MTCAQKLNKAYDKIWDSYHKQREKNKDLLPTCTDYGYFLAEAVKKFKIPNLKARELYGLFTYGQWRELLGT